VNIRTDAIFQEITIILAWKKETLKGRAVSKTSPMNCKMILKKC